MPQHRFKKGDPAINRKGRRKLTPDEKSARAQEKQQQQTLKELAAVHTQDALDIIVAIAKDATANKQVRLNACIELLDRGHGRAKPDPDGGPVYGLPVPVMILEMSHPVVAARLLAEEQAGGN